MDDQINANQDISLTVDDIVEILKVSGKDPQRMVRGYFNKRLIKGRQICREWRCHPKAIEDFLLGKS